MSDVTLIIAKKKHIPVIYKMQIEAFKKYHEKYKDSSSPGAEVIEKVKNRFSKKDTTYYLIGFNGTTVGALRLNRKSLDRGRISPIFILPEYQNHKIGQKAILKLEALHPGIKVWELSTIYQESKLCHFYESLGFRSFGKVKNVKRGLDLIAFRKICT